MIHIKELFRLQDIQHLRLIAGRDGLERTVTAAVLFEYDPSRVQLPDFYRGDLVVTTLAYARGDAQLVAHSLQALMNQGIASLMVKTAYFSELPQSVIALANRLGTPVFLFDDTYIEEVILQVTDLIRGKRHFSGFEQDVDALMRGDLTEEQTRERARRIDPVGHGRYRLYAVNPKERVVSLDDRLYALLETDADAARRCTFIEWRRMMLALCREEDGLTAEEARARFGDMLTRAGIDAQAVVIGQSDLREARAQLGTSMCEAVYAARAAKLCGKARRARAGALRLSVPDERKPLRLRPLPPGALRHPRIRRAEPHQSGTDGAGLRQGKHGDCGRRQGAVSASEHGALPPEQDSAHHGYGG